MPFLPHLLLVPVASSKSSKSRFLPGVLGILEHLRAEPAGMAAAPFARQERFLRSEVGAAVGGPSGFFRLPKRLRGVKKDQNG